MALLDEIISQRVLIYQTLEPFNIRWIRLYGSVLARKETEMSDVDLFVSFEEHSNGSECRKCRMDVEDAKFDT